MKLRAELRIPRNRIFILAGHSKQEVIAAIKAAIDKKELPPMEQGTVCYMMSKSSYLTDNGDHNAPHLMFYETAKAKADAAWGANVANAPVASVNYWYWSAEAYPQVKSLPPMAVFLVMVPKWSDALRSAAWPAHLRWLVRLLAEGAEQSYV